MKREHPFTNPNPDKNPELTGKSKMWEKEPQNEAGVDELLAVLGYKVRSSDMMEVAQKIQQLEEVIGKSQEDGLTQLGSDTVHYNPSDLSTWLESMLSELNPCPTLPVGDDPINHIIGSSSSGGNNTSSSISTVVDPDPVFSDYDLKAVPGKAILSPVRSIENNSKRLKPCYPDATRRAVAVVVVDPQENGIRLVHTLMGCAEAIQQQNKGLAEALVKQIGFLANSQAGSMGKVGTYFAQALARRVFKICAAAPTATTTTTTTDVPTFDDNVSEMLEMHFYETCPYLKFAHFTANQAILDAFSGKKSVHVIDFSMKQGMQWPALMQALALRPEGPPSFRLTGIGPPPPDNSDRLQEVGWKLAQFADSIHIKFEYRGFVANSLTDLEPGLLDLKPESETVAVNSVFELHRLLGRPGAVEKVLGMVKEVNPVIFTIVEQEASHNGPVFVDRFNEALHYYSTMFDSLETCVNNEDKMMTEVYLGRQICNIVACDGVDRVERHESLTQWRTRLNSAEFSPVHLGSNAFKQASMLLEFFAGGDGYGVEENGGCLMLGWHTRPLITTSAWQPAKKNPPTR